jgi:ABC-type amino acid transport system permease subunit
MAQLLTSNTEALIDGAPALLQTDVHPVVGCPFTPVAYSPCVTIRWVTAATQTSVRNVPVLLQTSVGLCLNAAQVPQGTAIVVQVQQRGKGT